VCNRCAELDAKIERALRAVGSGVDQLTRDRISEYLTELKSERANLHPPERDGTS
jgi:hypothetical protein